jgi:hypothetical protein
MTVKEKTPVVRVEPGDAIIDDQSDIRQLKEFLARFRSDAFLAVRGKKVDKHYMWVINHTRAVAQYLSYGFTVCKDPDIVVWDQGGMGSEKADGSKVVGDLILMEMPMERWRMFEELRLERLRDFLGGPKRAKEQFHHDGKSSGVETFEASGKTF